MSVLTLASLPRIFTKDATVFLHSVRDAWPLPPMISQHLQFINPHRSSPVPLRNAGGHHLYISMTNTSDTSPQKVCTKASSSPLTSRMTHGHTLFPSNMGHASRSVPTTTTQSA